MAHVDIEELAALALDPSDSTRMVQDHVSTCLECSALVDTLADVRRAAGAGPLVAAPAHLREHVLHEALTEPSRTDAPPAAPVSLEDRRRRRRLPLWAAGLAAAAALVAGLGLGRVTGGGTETPIAADPATVVAAADLTALDSDAPRGSASAVRTDDLVKLRVRATELGDEEGLHEVWLINLDGERMVSLGILAAGDDAEFNVPAGLIDEGYRIVDISVEPDDGDPLHSGVSLARGELA